MLSICFNCVLWGLTVHFRLTTANELYLLIFLTPPYCKNYHSKWNNFSRTQWRHPSPVSLFAYPVQVCGGAAVDPSCHRARGWVHDGQVYNLSPFVFPFRPTGNLESQMICLCLDWWRCCTTATQFCQKQKFYIQNFEFIRRTMFQKQVLKWRRAVRGLWSRLLGQHWDIHFWKLLSEPCLSNQGISSIFPWSDLEQSHNAMREEES